MSDNIVPLHQAKPGERSFVNCSCGTSQDAGSSLFAVVVMHDAAGEFICALVCPECEREIPISFGRFA